VAIFPCVGVFFGAQTVDAANYNATLFCTGGALSGKYMDMKSAPITSRMREYVGFMHRCGYAVMKAVDMGYASIRQLL
jgi:hypothetical protein